FGQHSDHGQTADKLRDEPEAQKVLRLDVLKDFLAVDFGCPGIFLGSAETHDVPAQPPLNNPLQSDECSAANEQNVGGVHADVLRLRGFASALGGHVAERSLQYL